MRTVSEQALVKRINRKLACQSPPMRMHVLSERSRWYNDMGRFYVVHLTLNRIEFPHVEIENYGRELGVLGATESLA